MCRLVCLPLSPLLEQFLAFQMHPHIHKMHGRGRRDDTVQCREEGNKG